MPAVPLGFTSKAQFYVMSQGYDNLQLKVTDVCSHDPMYMHFSTQFLPAVNDCIRVWPKHAMKSATFEQPAWLAAASIAYIHHHVVMISHLLCWCQIRAPPDEQHLPLSFDFPEGSLIGIAKEKLPVTVSFNGTRPTSYTASVVFQAEERKRFSLPITGCTDACLLTVKPFMDVSLLLLLTSILLEFPLC